MIGKNKDGVYYFSVRINEFGKLKQYTRQDRAWKTKRDAREAMESFKLSKGGSTSALTVNRLYEVYKQDSEAILKERTINVFDYQYREHIKPYFGDSVIDTLKPEDFREWQRSLIRKGYKNSYTWTIQSRLRAILNYGVRHGYLSINPFTVSNMRNIDERPKEMSFWTPEEFSRFIHQVKDQTYHAYFMTLFYAGLRKGEAMALTDSDIDFINSTIRVNKNLDYVVVKGDTSPKTFRSYRTVPLHPALRKELHELVLLHRKMSGYADDCYLFGYDTYLKPGKLRKTMIEAISLSGVRFIHIHELRHSYASLLINLGFTPMEVSKRIGDSMKMVSDTYGHLYPSGDELISSKLQKAYEEAEESIERSSGKA